LLKGAMSKEGLYKKRESALSGGKKKEGFRRGGKCTRGGENGRAR